MLIAVLFLGDLEPRLRLFRNDANGVCHVEHLNAVVCAGQIHVMPTEVFLLDVVVDNDGAVGERGGTLLKCPLGDEAAVSILALIGDPKLTAVKGRVHTHDVCDLCRILN